MKRFINIMVVLALIASGTAYSQSDSTRVESDTTLLEMQDLEELEELEESEKWSEDKVERKETRTKTYTNFDFGSTIN